MRKFPLLLLLLTATFVKLQADVSASYPPLPEDSVGATSPVATVTAQAALEWVTLLDQMRYDVSWAEAGSMLKDSITREQWIAALDATRRPLGYNSARKIRSQTKKKILPFGTVGEFLIIKYDSSFLGRSSAQETVTLMHEKDNSWRVINYFVN